MKSYYLNGEAMSGLFQNWANTGFRKRLFVLATCLAAATALSEAVLTLKDAFLVQTTIDSPVAQ